MAERAGISPDAVGSLERGFRKAPYRDTVDRLARALGVSADGRLALETAVRRARSGSLVATPASTAARNNLPRQVTSFLGREAVVSEVTALALSSTLVTIVGTGGIGKTRAAVHVGARLLEHKPDGVWFVDLASITGPEGVAAALAAALEVQEVLSQSLLETLVSHLKNKQMLLIVDNCEHLIERVAVVVTAILQTCPDISLLATSREPLQVYGERVYRIPPLAFPQEGDRTARDARSYSAVALFAERAVAADGAFALSDDIAPAVEEVCRRLDGVPLAIELAAARVRSLSPTEIARGLDERFSLLAGGDRNALPRQRTLLALIDWSYDLLEASEQRLFERLAIFPGSFDVDAMVATCSGDGIENAAAFNLFSSLVDKSLVVAEREGAVTRFRLLDSTRQYAMRKLDARGGQEEVAHRHATAVLSVAEDLDRSWYTQADREWIARAEPELDNFRAALDWAASATSEETTFLRLVAALARVWYSLQPVQGGRWLATAAGRVDGATDAVVVARIDVATAELHESRAQFKAALSVAERALARFTALGDSLGRVRAKDLVGSSLVGLGSVDEGERILREALDEARDLPSPRLVAMTLGNLGGARNRRGDFEGAREFYADALAFQRLHGFERQAASVAGNLAEVEFGRGNCEAALEHARAALEGHVALHNRRAIAIDLFNTAAYLIAVDRFDEARTAAFEALEVARELQARMFSALSLQHLAAIAALHPVGDEVVGRAAAERSACLLGFVDAIIAELGAVREFTERQEYERVVSVLLTALGKQQFERLMERGRAWSESRAIAEASEV